MEIILSISAIISFFLGIFVLLQNSRSWLHRWYSIFSFITGIWISVNLMAGIFPAIFWMKSAYAFGMLVAITALMWILLLCEEKVNKLKIYLIWAGALLFFIISYINELIIKNITKIYLGGYKGETGPFFLFYTIYLFGILFFSIYKLLSKYKKVKGIKKLQLKYTLLGAFSWVTIVTIVSFILPLFGILQYTALDTPSTLIFLIFTTYAITKHHLFNIRVIATELLVGLVSIILFIDLFLSKSLPVLLLKGGILLAFIYVGFGLIKSVLREIERREELERLSKAKSEFISITSHQLRTPLSTVKGYISMLREGVYGKLPNKMRQPMENVYKSNERLIKQVNDLLNISRIETGKIEIELEKIAIEDVISEVIQELEIKAKTKGLDLKWQKPSQPLPKITTDKEKLRQIILNIIDNAIRYTNKGYIAVKVKHQSFFKSNHRFLSKQNSSQRDKIIIEIKDTGEGLTKEEIAHIFDSFSRGKAGTRFWTEGAGLGLYIARRFIELLNGKIWAESKGRGEGSTFYIELPVK